MSLRFTSEELADLRHHARLLIAQTSSQEGQLEVLAVAAAQDMQQSEAALSNAAGLDDEHVRHLLTAQLHRSAAGATTARRLCVSAHAQLAAARHLLAHLGNEASARAPRPNAVLVVDDYDELREGVALLLRQAGFVVSTATNGLEGLIKAHEMRPAVIVMDVSMPVLDGIEATRLIKAGEMTREARVIAYTGDPAFENSTTRMLFAAILQKPASPDDLLATVQHVAAL